VFDAGFRDAGKGSSVDKSTLGGISLALAGISIGLYLDGGKVGQLLQPTAALIVFGGTLGAVMVQFPFPLVLQAARQLKEILFGVNDPARGLIQDFVRYSTETRRNGLMSLDAELDRLKDPFLKKVLMLAVDGVRAPELRERMELEMDLAADKEDLIPKVFEAAGGYAPTIGILGAVIGLIQVMQRIENIGEVGKGIAVAFVATIYGVGSANILFLPMSGRAKQLVRRRQVLRELVLDGVVCLIEKTNPRVMESKLEVYLAKPAPAADENRVAV
jgi:chemotaxis protein MotA